MSFTLKANGDTKEFEQMSDLVCHIQEKLAQWNNIDYDEGEDSLELSISKPHTPEALGIYVRDETIASERLS